MHPALSRLQPYPFERLARLFSGVTPPAGLKPIALSIGEPKHAPPRFVLDALVAALDSLGTYPATAGIAEFRQAVATWLEQRYRLGGTLDEATMILPVNGTREALFAVAQALIDPAAAARVAMPNPCYQIYEGAALLAGATPYFLDTTAANGFVPDLAAVPAAVWRDTRLLYLCSPGNPSGAVLDLGFMRRALELADEHDFVIAADECYAEIYGDESAPPVGFLEACHGLGRRRFERVLVFHSLSKRSSLPGLRSGFVAGDPRLIEQFRLYRTYHGCALPVHVQRASALAWSDNAHVVANRALYRAKFDAVLPVLAPLMPVSRPEASFYLWPDVSGDDEAFAKALYAEESLTVLPGRYLGRESLAGNPGAGRVRISLVPPLEDCLEAAHRIRRFLGNRPLTDRLKTLIESHWDGRAELSPGNAPAGLAGALEEALELLDCGRARVAEPTGSGWVVNQWLKKAVLLYFRTHDNSAISAGYTTFFDKVPLKYSGVSEAKLRDGGSRIVPPAVVRRGAFIAPGVVLMPSYVNIGAYVDSGTMVDTWATVGSCAQIGRNVHLSGGVGIGGVLEPLQASPTIIEDDCFIGARSEIVEGVVVERGAVVSMGVFIGASTKIYDRATGTVSYGRVPAGAVVVSGNLPSPDGRYSLYCAVIVKRVDAKTRAKTSINELLRD